MLGLLGMALPLTLFLGTDGLAQVTADPAALGAGLIVASAVAKILATTGALSFGFVGGPIFPLLFIGGSLGSVAHLAVEDIPLGLAVTAMMAAVPSAVIPVPLSIATLTVLIAGIPPTESTSVFVAAILSLIAGRLIEAALPSPDGAAKSETFGWLMSRPLTDDDRPITSEPCKNLRSPEVMIPAQLRAVDGRLMQPTDLTATARGFPRCGPWPESFQAQAEVHETS